MRFFTQLGRWADIICYAVVGAGCIDYVGQSFAERVSSKTKLLFGDSYVGSIALFLSIIFALIVLYRFCGTRFRQFKSFIYYPPLPSAVLLAIALAPLLPEITNGRLASRSLPWEAAGMLTTIFSLLWIAFMAFRAIGTRLAKEGIPKKETSGIFINGTLSDQGLKDWLKREQPIDSESHDLFGITPFAERLFDRLKRGENTIALQGAFGSGKSSVAAILRAISKKRSEPLIFVPVSCWGFDDAAKAQQAILDALIHQMSKQVDTLVVQGIPKDYLDAVGEHVGWLRSILRLGETKRSPLQQLQRLSPLLAAVGHRAVIFIEDVDRSTAASFDVSQIQALLVRFREVEGLSFVLSISPSQAIDFARLCEFVEIMPDLAPEQSLPLIHRVRELLLLEHPAGVMLDNLEPLQSDDEGYSPLYDHIDYYWPWALALSSLLTTPRILKHALRRLTEAWPELRGEVKIDDLLGLSALRIAAPEAFDFFQRRRDFFTAASRPKTPNLRDDARIPFREEMTKEWDEICRKARFDSRAAAKIMHKIAPGSGAITGEHDAHSASYQSMHSQRRGKAYGRRLLTESKAPNEISDQKVLSLLKKPEDDVSLDELAELITDSKSASDVFEEFAPATDFKAHLPLLSKVYDVIRRQEGARLSREQHPGFFAPWRLVGRYNRPEGFQAWLINELEKCIPSNLHLLNEIYYFWLGTDQHNASERDAPRRAVYEKLKQVWPTLSSDKIANGFDPLFPYVLFHLVFTSDYTSPDTVPFGKAEDWIWMGPFLLSAARQSPSVMIPQIIVTLNTVESRGGEIPRFEFDERILQLWFGDRTVDLLHLVVSTFRVAPELTAQAKYLLGLAVEKARERLNGSG